MCNSSRFTLTEVSGDFAIRPPGPWMSGGRGQPLHCKRQEQKQKREGDELITQVAVAFD